MTTLDHCWLTRVGQMWDGSKELALSGWIGGQETGQRS